MAGDDSQLVSGLWPGLTDSPPQLALGPGEESGMKFIPGPGDQIATAMAAGPTFRALPGVAGMPQSAAASRAFSTPGQNPIVPIDPLDIISHYESRNQNILQTAYSGEPGAINPSTGTHTARSSASGPWQITDSTWNQWAPKAGVDTSQYPTAMSAPVDLQRKVAQYGYDNFGYAPWAPWNSRLAKAVGWGGSREQEQTGSTDLSTGGQPVQPQASPAPVSLPPPPAAPDPSAGLPLMLLGGLLKGVKFTPVSYDPFKIWKLGVNPVNPSYRLGSIGGG